VGGRWLYK